MELAAAMGKMLNLTRNLSVPAILAAGFVFALDPALAAPGGGHSPAPGPSTGQGGSHGTPALKGEEEKQIRTCFSGLSGSGSAITQLRDQRWGYGDIVTALYLVQRYPSKFTGRTTSAKISDIFTMRTTDHMGWGEITKKLGLPEDIVGKAEKACNAK